MRGIINIIRLENIVFVSQIIKHVSHSRCWDMITLSAMPLKKSNHSHVTINYWKKVILIVHPIFVLNKLLLLLFIFRIFEFVLFFLFTCNVKLITLIKEWVIFLIFFNINRLNSSMDTNKFLAVWIKFFYINWIKMRTNVFLQKKCFVHKKELSWL